MIKALLVATLGLTQPIQGNSGIGVCKPYAIAEKELWDKYRERPVAIGSIKGIPRELMVFSSENGETYTLGILHRSGTFCEVGQGENWTLIDPKWGEKS